MFYIEIERNIEERGTESKFDWEGKNLKRIYVNRIEEIKERMIELIEDINCDYEDLNDIMENQFSIPTIKLFKFEDKILNFSIENRYNLDKFVGYEILKLEFDLYTDDKNIYYDIFDRSKIEVYKNWNVEDIEKILEEMKEFEI